MMFIKKNHCDQYGNHNYNGSMSLMFEKFTMINENTDTNIPIRVSIFISLSVFRVVHIFLNSAII
jgi:hypothetical protein